MNDYGPATLQLLDHFDASLQLFLAGLQVDNLFDLLVDLDDLIADQLIAFALTVDCAFHA